MPILWNAAPRPGQDPQPTYAGAVLGITGRDVRIMSDVWAWMTFAQVWDGTQVREQAVGNSEFGQDATVVVDATLDVLDAAAAWYAAQAAAAAKREAEASVDRAIGFARQVAVGRDVTVVKGRKVPIGTSGRVFWMGSSQYGMRVGIETASAKPGYPGTRLFTALSNVEVTSPDDYLDIEALMARRAA